jgi:hypothetical protein
VNSFIHRVSISPASIPEANSIVCGEFEDTPNSNR